MQTILSVTAVMCAFIAPTTQAEDNPLRQYFPYGVYIAGNNPDGMCTDIKDADQVRASVERACKDVAAHHMNAVWPNNLISRNRAPWLEMAEKYGLRVVPQSGGPPTFIRGSYYKDKDDLVKQVGGAYKNLTEQHGKHAGLLAWSIGEESKPLDWVYAGAAEVTRQMAKWDPLHPAIMLDNSATSATMNAQRVRPKAMAMDCYPFFVNPSSGPSTPLASRSYWTRQCERMHHAATSIDAPYWMMGQAMELQQMRGDDPPKPIWGRPTNAQLRWQVWAAVQRGATGFFYFIYRGPFRQQPRATGESMIGLVDQHGKETELYREAARVGKRLKVLGPVLLSLQVAPADQQVEYWENTPVSARTHIDRATGRRFVSMVNNDWDQEQKMGVDLGYFPGMIDKAEKLYDIETGSEYDKAKTLDPGDIAIYFVGTPAQWKDYDRTSAAP